MPRPRKTSLLPLESELRTAAEVLYREIDPASVELVAWAQQSGLVNGKTDLKRVFAQQAALELLLLTVAERLPASALEHLPLREIAAQLPYSRWLASTEARRFLGDPDRLVTLLTDALPRDLLGELYEVLTPQAERRTLGQYWTPQPLVEFMTAWALPAGGRILEPALGSGRFLQEVERRLAENPNEAQALVRGYEVSPLVMMVAIVNAALRRTRNVRFDLRLESFLEAQGDGELFDGIVCNPPYTRHHHITPDQKARLAAQIEQTFRVSLSGFTSLFVYFLLHALRQVRQGGRLAFITPSELYEASYATALKTILRREAQPEAIIVFDQSHQVFEGVDTAGCITLAQRGGAVDGQTLLIEVREWPGTAALLQVVEQRQVGQFPWGTATLLAADALTPTAKWSNPRQMTLVENAEPRDHLPTLGSLAKVVRGVATGANDYFCLNDAEIQANGLPFEYFQRVITKTRTIRSYTLAPQHLIHMQQEGHKVWLFTCYEPRHALTPALRRYVEYGEKQNLHERSLLQLKKARWYMVEKRPPPPILFTYLSRGATRFIYNAAGAQALNVFLLIYPKAAIAGDAQRLKAFTAVLNSGPIRRGLHVVGRSYGGDTVKLEPRELDRLPVLDPSTLPAATVNQLAELLDSLDTDDTGAQQIELDALVTQLIQGQPATPPLARVLQPLLF